jgi:putative transposase
LLQEGRVKEMVETVWLKLADKYPSVVLDEFIVMPNHVHGIIILTEEDAPHYVNSSRCRKVPVVGADPCVCPQSEGEHMGSPLRVPLGQIIQWFKTLTTNRYITGVKQLGWPPFPGSLWQRNYYEHIVRNDRELRKIREYVRYNPLKWHCDIYNPDRERDYTDFEDYLNAVL